MKRDTIVKETEVRRFNLSGKVNSLFKLKAFLCYFMVCGVFFCVVFFESRY